MTAQPASLHTAHMVSLVEHWRAGDKAAGEELFEYVQQRLQHFAQQMLRYNRDVRTQVETADLVQQSCVRLLQALQRVTPTSMAHFRNVAYQHVRWELRSLAARFQGRRAQPLPEHVEPVAPGTTPEEQEDLEKWAAFYEAVGKLPEKDRTLFDLRFFEGLKWAEIADELGIHERNARERWARVLIALRKAVGDWLPPADELPA
jgi:RNA polymerase sigma-70 factor, ECF subfamily